MDFVARSLRISSWAQQVRVLVQQEKSIKLSGPMAGADPKRCFLLLHIAIESLSLPFLINWLLGKKEVSSRSRV